MRELKAEIKLAHFFKCASPCVQNILEKFDVDHSFDNQLQCVNNLSRLISEEEQKDEREVVLDVLTFLFLSITGNNPLKKTITRILSQTVYEPLVEEKLNNALLKILHYIDEFQNHNTDLPKVFALKDYLVCAFISSLDVSKVFKPKQKAVQLIFDFTFTHLYEIVNILDNKDSSYKHINLENASSIIHNSNKCILTLLQKYKLEVVHQKNVVKIISCCLQLMNLEVSYETKSNSAFIITILCIYLPENIISECALKEYPQLEFLKLGKETSVFLDKLNIKPFKNEGLFETFKVSLYVSILFNTPKSVLCHNLIYKKVIALFLLEEILNAAKRTNKNSSVTIGIAKGISFLSQFLDCLPTEEVNSYIKDIFNYIHVFLDSRVEIVRHHVKLVYKNIIKWLLKVADEQDHPKVVTQWVLQFTDCTAYYIGLLLLSEIKGCHYILNIVPELPKQLLSQMDNVSKLHMIYPCYESLMKLALTETDCVDSWINYWVKGIMEALKIAKPPLRSYYQKLFLVAFTAAPVTLKILTQEEFINTSGELGALFSCFQYARRNKIYIPVNTFTNQIHNNKLWRNLIPYKTLQILSTTQIDNVRLLVLEIIAECKSTTELFDDWELKLLVEYVYYNINTLDSSVRQQILTYIKKAMLRVKEGEATLKKYENNKEVVASRCYLHLQFWIALYKICSKGLNPGCNYGRRSSCLDIATYVIDALQVIDFENLFNDNDLSNLKYIVEYDTYEQNKRMAVNLINHFSSDKLGFVSVNTVQKHILDCFETLINVKPSKTISAAYMLRICLKSEYIQAAAIQLIEAKNVGCLSFYNCDILILLIYNIIVKLDDCYFKGKSNLQEAATKYPVYGLLFCLRQLLQLNSLVTQTETVIKAWRLLYRDILGHCFQLGGLVETIICNPSPEGFLPDDIDNTIDETSKAQMITVFGWRTAKEISLLLGEIALNATYSNEKDKLGIIEEEQFQQIGNFFYNLLLNTKHRGAFEQASIGFYHLCYRLHRINNITLNGLPRAWLTNIINALLTNANTINTCATRRSAGVPFMIQAILASEPKSSNCSLLHYCFGQLLSPTITAEEEKIHSMNILRALFRHTQLSSYVSKYASDAMIIAISGFGSKIWGIRNSATLLFSALMNQIFGVLRTRNLEEFSTKNKMMFRVFLIQYQELFAYMLKELKKNSTKQNNQHSSLFPILLVLNRLYNLEQSNKCSDDVISNVWFCLGNCSYKIRNLAAKTFVNLLHPNDIERKIVHTLVVLSNVKISNNFLHGLLMQLQYLLKRKSLLLNIPKIIDSTSWIIICCPRQISYFNATLYLDIIMNLIIQFDPHFRNCQTFDMILSILHWYKDTSLQIILSSSPSVETYRTRMFNLKLYWFLHYINCKKCKRSSNPKISILDDLSKYIELQHMCINYVSYLYFTTTSEYAHHDLYMEFDDWEHAELIKQLLKPLKQKHKILLHHFLSKLLLKTCCGGKNLFQIQAELFSLRFLPNLQKFTSLTKLFHSNYEQVVTLSIATLDMYLKNLTIDEMRLIDFNIIISIIHQCCSPLHDSIYRRGICKLLINNKDLFWKTNEHLTDGKHGWITENNKYDLWLLVLILLEDDDDDVRNMLCHLSRDETQNEANYHGLFVPRIRLDIPEYSRQKCLDIMISSLSMQFSTNVLLSLILRSPSVTNMNNSEVFDEGELNMYAETYPTSVIACKKLKKLFNKLGDDKLSINEQIIKIVNNLIDKFNQNEVAFISKHVSSVILAFFDKIHSYLIDQTMPVLELKNQLKYSIDLLLKCELARKLDLSELNRLRLFLNIFNELVSIDN